MWAGLWVHGAPPAVPGSSPRASVLVGWLRVSARPRPRSSVRGPSAVLLLSACGQGMNPASCPPWLLTGAPQHPPLLLASVKTVVKQDLAAPYWPSCFFTDQSSLAGTSQDRGRFCPCEPGRSCGALLPLLPRGPRQGVDPVSLPLSLTPQLGAAGSHSSFLRNSCVELKYHAREGPRAPEPSLPN